MFSDEWMKKFMQAWNDDTELVANLAKISFNSIIGYGVQDEEKTRGIIVIENGKATSAGAYNGEELNWDLRAKEENWEKWMQKPPGMMGLGTAYASGKLKFEVGDYGAMVKNPAMAGPFIKTFAIMGQV